MKKLFKKSLLTISSLASIAGATTAVVSCGKTADDKPVDDINDEIKTNFNLAVEKLASQLDQQVLTFKAGENVTRAVFIDALKVITDEYRTDTDFQGINFNTLDLIDNPEESIDTSSSNTEDGQAISFEILFTHISNVSIQHTVSIDMTYNLLDRKGPETPTYSAEELQPMLNNIVNNITFTEKSDKTGYEMNAILFDYAANKINESDLVLEFGQTTDDNAPTSWTSDQSELNNLGYSTYIWVTFKVVQGSDAKITNDLSAVSKKVPAKAFNTYKATDLENILSTALKAITVAANSEDTAWEIKPFSFNYEENKIDKADLEIVYSTTSDATPPALTTYVSDISTLPNLTKGNIWATFKILSSSKAEIEGQITPVSRQLDEFVKKVEPTTYTSEQLNIALSTFASTFEFKATSDNNSYIVTFPQFNYGTNGLDETKVQLTFATSTRNTSPEEGTFTTDSSILNSVAPSSFVWASFKVIDINTKIEGQITPVSKQVPEKQDVSLGTVEDWDKIIGNMKTPKYEFDNTTETYKVVGYPDTDAWPSKASLTEARYVYSTDGGLTYGDRDTVAVNLKPLSVIKVSLRANAGYMIGDHKEPISKDFTIPAAPLKSLGSVETWKPVIDSISVTFNYDITSKTYTATSPATKLSWPNGAGLDKVHYEYSLDNKEFSADINKLTNLTPKSTIYVTLRAGEGYEFEGGKLLDALPILVPDVPEIGTTEAWQAIVDSINPEFNYDKDSGTYNVTTLPDTNTWPNSSGLNQAHFEYSTDNINFSNDIATLSKLQVDSKIYIRLAANDGYRIGLTNEPLKAKEIQVPAVPVSITTKEQMDIVVDSINIKIIDNGDETISRSGLPSSKGWPEGAANNAHYVYSIDGINFSRSISVINKVPKGTTIYISIRANAGYKIENFETPKAKEFKYN